MVVKIEMLIEAAAAMTAMIPAMIPALVSAEYHGSAPETGQEQRGQAGDQHILW